MRQVARKDAQVRAGTEEARSRNMRQLLLRASRTVSRQVVEGLHAHGYTGLRSTHTALLSNMPLAGGTVTETAERAGMTKQAMGRLAAELENAGYIRVTADPADRRAKRLELTKIGKRLMLDSLDVMAQLERRYADLIGPDRLQAVLDGLRAFNEAAD
ncbi:MAG: MarR family transcriptional regulator [Verrucomicrobia bacterium]|nr:MarR family transcriptional regulator [Verrucomicrobiota bacterium]